MMDAKTKQEFNELLDALPNEKLDLVIDYIHYLAQRPLAPERIAELKAHVEGLGLEFPVRS